jgi:hypothetical protein
LLRGIALAGVGLTIAPLAGQTDATRDLFLAIVQNASALATAGGGIGLGLAFLLLAFRGDFVG